MIAPTNFVYHDIVWAKTNKSFPWWPCLICDPEEISDSVAKRKGMSLQGKKYTLLCYGEGTFDFALPSQLASFNDDYKLHSQQLVGKKYQVQFHNGLKLANEEIRLSKEDRAAWLRPDDSSFLTPVDTDAEEVEVTNKHQQERKKMRNSGPRLISGASTPSQKRSAPVGVGGGFVTSKKIKGQDNSITDEQGVSIPEAEDPNEDLLYLEEESVDEEVCSEAMESPEHVELAHAPLIRSLLNAATVNGADGVGDFDINHIKKYIVDGCTAQHVDVSAEDIDSVLSIAMDDNKIFISDDRLMVI